jgi:hypothetical protein
MMKGKIIGRLRELLSPLAEFGGQPTVVEELHMWLNTVGDHHRAVKLESSGLTQGFVCGELERELAR